MMDGQLGSMPVVVKVILLFPYQSLILINLNWCVSLP